MRIHSKAGKFSVLAAAAGLVLASPAWCQTENSGTFKTGEELYSLCSSSDDGELADCDYYIMGVHDAIILHQDLGWTEKTICIPVGTESEELRETVLAYFAGSETLNFTAVSMVYNALEEAYSC
jgi:hypothetical protein